MRTRQTPALRRSPFHKEHGYDVGPVARNRSLPYMEGAPHLSYQQIQPTLAVQFYSWVEFVFAVVLSEWLGKKG